jgi:hypothetical protein
MGLRKRDPYNAGKEERGCSFEMEHTKEPMGPCSESGERREHLAVRKPYVKPAFQFERVFETMALACGKVSFQQRQCRFGRRKNS